MDELIVAAKSHGLEEKDVSAFLMWVANEVAEGREVESLMVLAARARELFLMFRNARARDCAGPGTPKLAERPLPTHCSRGHDIPHFGTLKRSDVDWHAGTHYLCPDCGEDDCCPMVYHCCKATGRSTRCWGPPAKQMPWAL